MLKSSQIISSSACRILQCHISGEDVVKTEMTALIILMRRKKANRVNDKVIECPEKEMVRNVTEGEADRFLAFICILKKYSNMSEPSK